jgi:hypothetical protein
VRLVLPVLHVPPPMLLRMPKMLPLTPPPAAVVAAQPTPRVCHYFQHNHQLPCNSITVGNTLLASQRQLLLQLAWACFCCCR